MSSIKVEELAKGIQLCVKNAAGLIEDARLLFNKNRFARCFSLCVLAMEEIGKIEVIARGVLISETDEKKWKRFEKNFKSHEIKQSSCNSHATGRNVEVPRGIWRETKTELTGPLYFRPGETARFLRRSFAW